MKIKTVAILVASIIILNIGFFINYQFNKPQNDFIISVKVIRKNEHKREIHRKNYVEYAGMDRSFTVQDNIRGFGEIPVTVNTFETTKVGDQISFTATRDQLSSYFSLKIDDPFLLEIPSLILIALLSAFVIVILLLCIKPTVLK